MPIKLGDQLKNQENGMKIVGQSDHWTSTVIALWKVTQQRPFTGFQCTSDI